jgi:hypothetical protein
MRILSVFVITVAAALACGAQVYSVGIYSIGRTYEHDWTLGSGSLRFGFEQYRQYRDAGGRDLHSFSDVTALGVTSPRYSILYFGPVHFTVPGPAWAAAALSGVAVVSLVLLFAVAVSRMWKHHTHAHDDA